MSTLDRSSNRVTVVIPTWNNAATLERALQSVLRQTLPAAQVWVLDDASSDDTVQVAQAFIQKNGLEHWHVQAFEHNRGPSRARNWGWDHASGDYVAFLDADDSWLPHKLEYQTHWMQAHPEFSASGHGHQICIPSIPANIGKATQSPKLKHKEITKIRILLGNVVVTPSVMVRRNGLPRFDEASRHMEDHMLWMRMILQGHRFVKLDADLAVIHKPQWGSSGLSAQMWRMEKAELKNYAELSRQDLLNWWALRLLQLWSLIKHGRRMLIRALKN